ncbi:hypothetical protein ACFE04_021466 [Oxalis oulophora]
MTMPIANVIEIPVLKANMMTKRTLVTPNLMTMPISNGITIPFPMWTVPLEKPGLMKSVTQMEYFLVGVIYNFYSNLILANVCPNSKYYHCFKIRSTYLDFSPEKINKFLERKDDEFVEEINFDEMVSCVTG